MTTGLPSIPAYPMPRPSELPPSRAGWTPDPGRAALLIHDMQNYFLRPFPPNTDPVSPLLANVGTLAAAARRAGVPVFFTAQDGDQDRRDRGLQAELWGKGMSRAPDQQPIVDALAPLPGDIVLVKHRYSAFQRSNLQALMRARNRDQLVVCGIYAHIGCLLTTADAFMRDIEPFFVADAVADFSRDKHLMALAYVAGTCGVVCTTAQVAERL